MGSGKYGIDWGKPTTWLIIGFIALLAWLLTKEADAAETSMELAPGTLFVTNDRYAGGALFLEELIAGKYAFGVGLTTTWDCIDDCSRGDGPTNQVFYMQRVVRYKRLGLGIGASYWHNLSPAWSSHTPFALSLEWHFTDHASVRIFHFSTGGSSDRNGGLNMLNGKWTF